MAFQIFKRGDIYHFSGTVGGKRERGSTGAKTREAALAFTAEFEAKARKCRADGPQAVLTFEDAVLNYFAAEKTERFIAKPRVYFRNHLVKDISAGVIRQAAIDIYPDASAATRNRQLIVPVQAVINHCADLQLCSAIRVKRFPVEKKEKTPVTVEWVRAFAKAAPPHLAALALFLFGTGARISEALNLRWEDVNLQAGTAKISQGKQRNERTARLHPEVIAAMANLKRYRGRGPFFYLERSSAYGAWDRTCERAGLPFLSFHSCRHGFATALLHKGVDVLTVAKRGGWKSARHVFETYGHASEDASVVDRIFDPILPQQEIANSRKPPKTGTS